MNEILTNFKKAVSELMDGKLSSSDSCKKGNSRDLESQKLTDNKNSDSTLRSGRFNITNGNNGPRSATSASSKKGLIAEGMTVVGNVCLTDADIEIFGKIEGKINCSGGVVYVFGSCSGDITAQNIFLYRSASVVGNLEAIDAVAIDEGCELKGNIKTLGNVSVKGALIGNILTQDNVCLGTNSIVDGDISAASLEIIKGARFNGSIELLQNERLRRDDNLIMPVSNNKMNPPSLQ